MTNSKYIKKLNRLKILNIIKNNPSATRSQLAEVTGLTPPAITGIIRELIDRGFVREVGLGRSYGGRKPVKLEINENKGYVIGIEVTRQEVTIGVADLINMPHHIERQSADMSCPDKSIADLINIIKKIQDDSPKPILGVGIAFPGLLKSRSGIITRSVNLGSSWNNYNVRAALTEAVNIPIYMDNNSNVAALAEKYFGYGKTYENLVYVNVGEGISAGILADDSIIQGYSGYAGEVGHTVVVPQGPLCNCGNRGCLEALCGIPALLCKVNSEIRFINESDSLYSLWRQKKYINFDDLKAAARVKDSYSYNVFRQVGRYLGVALANIINLYNPDVIFIGGKLSQASDVFWDVMIDSIHSNAFPDIARTTDIKLSKLGESSGVAGACALVVRELFSSSDSELLKQG